jgi:hypothetical protein
MEDVGIKTYPAMNSIFIVEQPRLAALLLQDLKIFELHPNDASLKVFYDKAVTNLARSMVRVSEFSYVQGCRDAIVHPNSSDLLRLKRDENSYALLGAKQITSATAHAYGLNFSAALSKRYAGSKERADLISGDQLKQSFFRAVVKAWGQYRSSAKKWVLSGDHDKDDICDENAEQGPISIDDDFASGDDAPPAHINCECFLRLYRQHIRTRS